MFNRRSPGVLINPGCPGHGRCPRTTCLVNRTNNDQRQLLKEGALLVRYMVTNHAPPQFLHTFSYTKTLLNGLFTLMKGENSFVQVFVILSINIAAISVCVYSHTFFHNRPEYRLSERPRLGCEACKDTFPSGAWTI